MKSRNRRQDRAAVFLVGLCLSVAGSAADHADIRVDGERLNATMDRMKTFGGNAEGGSDRVAFTEHNRNALRYLGELMSGADMDVHTDFAGNLIGPTAGIR